VYRDENIGVGIKEGYGNFGQKYMDYGLKEESGT
jgi:hypothetical protein